MNNDELKDEIIRLQSVQIKNLLEKLELSLPYQEFLNNSSKDESDIHYKELYEIIVSSPSYKVGKKISAVLDFLHIKKFLHKFHSLI